VQGQLSDCGRRAHHHFLWQGCGGGRHEDSLWIVKKKKGKVISSETVEVARYDHVYDSTAAYGGTIFWKNNPDYVKATGAKEYK
jgi:hypothetical protein